MQETYLPFFLKNSTISSILIIGGGNIAVAKIEALLSVNATFSIVTKNISNELRNLCDTKGYSYTIGEYQPEYLTGQRLVIAATNDSDINQRIYHDCKDRGIFINVVDSPQLCDFIFPAILKRGPLQIAISSSGKCPVAVRIIKQRIEQIIPLQFEKLIDFLHKKKNELRIKLKIQPRRLFLEKFINSPIAEQFLTSDKKEAEYLFTQALKNYCNQNLAALYVLPIVEDNLDLLTVKSIRLLSYADVVVYDNLIPTIILEQYVRKDAHKINCSILQKHNYNQESTIKNNLIIQYLKTGNIVVLLTSKTTDIYKQYDTIISIAKELKCFREV